MVRLANWACSAHPSFIVDGELFWANDHLDDALAWAKRSAA